MKGAPARPGVAAQGVRAAPPATPPARSGGREVVLLGPGPWWVGRAGLGEFPVEAVVWWRGTVMADLHTPAEHEEEGCELRARDGTRLCGCMLASELEKVRC